jgi:3-dehydroquinate synthase
VKQIKLDLKENGYQIVIGKQSLAKLVDKINSLPITKCLLIIDKNVEKYHSNKLRNILANVDCKISKYVFTATEKNKNINNAEKIFKYLSDNFFDRNSVVVGVGGGITGDLTGFVASTFMRGISYFNVPTTLLAMVDSSVGGKTGVNSESRKNLIGTFHQPSGVFVDDVFLSTLPKKEITSGSGEIFKYSFLADEKNYRLLKNSLNKILTGSLNNYEATIQNCLKIKSYVVSKDEKEKTGLRKILNLGHTFAHAYEVVSNYQIKHGEAVIGGIFSALFVSEKLGYLSTLKLNEFLSDFTFIKLNKKLRFLDDEKVYKVMLGDKKNLAGKINLVLIEDIGKIIVDAPACKTEILDGIRKMKSLI